MKLSSKFIWMLAFAIAMGFLEGAVVVYLREIYYPEGFKFPLVPIESRLALTEIIRELATIIMLVSVAVLAGKTFSQRFAWFIFSFGVWDIFYYVSLKLILGWPESLGTWDILFLIPVIWVGIVFDPVLLSVLMILFAVMILYYADKNPLTKITGREWLALITGSAFVIASFTIDYLRFIFSAFSFGDLFNAAKKEAIFQHLSTYVPENQYILIFSIGVGLICLAIIDFFFRNRNENKGRTFENP